MQKKDIGLATLVVTVGAIVAMVNPRFLSPINLANTANLIGLFGLFSIAEAFVIVTAGIELSIGSVIALLGVIFVDLIASPSACPGRWRWRSSWCFRSSSASCTAG
jgi:ribose transport system permease protein